MTRGKNQGVELLSLPALIFLGLFFLVPMLRLMLLSVENGSLVHYERAVTDGLYVHVILNTLFIAVSVSVICLLLAYPLAYFLTVASPRGATFAFIVLLLPFWTSILVRTYAWMVLLGRNGVINQALLSLGIISDPLPLLNNLTGVLIGMVHVLLPYMVFPLYAVMRRIDLSLLSAAEGLGASGWKTFQRIYLPLTMPGILSGTTLVFILSLGFFITPALLGGGRVIMIAVLIEQQVREFLNWGFASALAMVLLAAALLIYVLLQRLLRSDLEWH